MGVDVAVDVGVDVAGEARALSPNAAAYADTSDGDRLVAIQQLSAALSATHAELLDLIAAADACGDWQADGASGPIPWLVGHAGVARRTSVEWNRVAQALQALPALRAAYAEGRLSWDQVRAAARFVTPDDDEHFAEMLPGFSTAQIELMARQRRPIPDADARDAHANRGLSWRRDHRRGGFSYNGFLPFDQGAAVNAALDRYADRAGPNAATGTWDPVAQRRADALHDLATRAVAGDPDPDRATVVIHADAKVIDGEVPGNGFLGDVAICQTSLMRSLCHARVEVALHGLDGTTVGIARASQQIPAWLGRHIGARDGTCRFPGCERLIRQIHHIHHWARGGETNADNLVGLCWLHHHLVHEGGWTIDGDPDAELGFVRPDGRRLTSRPLPLDPKVRTQLRRINGGSIRPARVSGRSPRRGPPGNDGGG